MLKLRPEKGFTGIKGLVQAQTHFRMMLRLRRINVSLHGNGLHLLDLLVYLIQHDPSDLGS